MAKTFQEILNSMLAEIGNSMDKREGSLIWSALAPSAAQLAEGYVYFDNYVDLLMADTATGEYLDRLCCLAGLKRNPAIAAEIIGEFRDGDNSLFDVEIGAEFACGAIVYEVKSKISIGKFLLTAKEGGTVGNKSAGNLLPVDYISDLFSGEIIGISKYGEDAESDDDFRSRYIENLTIPAFGGNVADYERRVLEFKGVGAVKVFPVCSGAGTVGIVIGSESGRSADDDLVQLISEAFNKTDSQNFSCGLAPIGHTVMVKSASDLPVDIGVHVTLENGILLAGIQEKIIRAVEDYIKSIGFNQSMIHTAPIEMAVLSVPGVVDIDYLTINGIAGTYNLNKSFENFQVPVFGALTMEV